MSIKLRVPGTVGAQVLLRPLAAPRVLPVPGEGLRAGAWLAGWLAGCALAGEQLLAVATAEQEEETVQVVAQVLDAIAGLPGRDH